MWVSMLTVLLIKRRAQSHTDDRLAAAQTVRLVQAISKASAA